MSFKEGLRYNDYGSFLQNIFPGHVQKISLNAGFSCPNRDGTKGIGGCTYCNNKSFNPAYCKPGDGITKQLEQGIAFFGNKKKEQHYLAYFQAYTNTHGELKRIKKQYLEALNHPQIVGLIIGTRPDCISEELVEFLSELAKETFITVELGIESTLNRTLELVNRCHSYEDAVSAFKLLQNKGIHLGAHLIIGLPGETQAEILQHADRISHLPVHSIKLHHLQIIKYTVMERQYREDPSRFNLYDTADYIELMTDFVPRLRKDIVIERFISQAPGHLLVAPLWGGIKNFEISHLINKRLTEKNLQQGMQCKQKPFMAK